MTAGPVLALRVASRPGWIHNALQDLPRLFSDHAHCERKAAASALSMVSRVPSDPALVRSMAALAREESGHLMRVVAVMRMRGWPLRDDHRDEYVLALRARLRKGRAQQVVDELTVAGLIEARSAERLDLLARHVPDAGLARFYAGLHRLEGSHALLFIRHAQRLAGGSLAEDLEGWLDHEARVVTALTDQPLMHG